MNCVSQPKIVNPIKGGGGGHVLILLYINLEKAI